MRVTISHRLTEPLEFPINYHHIQQAIIYRGFEAEAGQGAGLHDAGAAYEKRVFKLFTFGPFCGKYEVQGKKIIFSHRLSFTVSGLDANLIRQLGTNIQENGICYGSRRIDNVDVEYSDATVETEQLVIRMVSPICVYATDRESGKTIFYSPTDAEFGELVNDNFHRKYAACYKVEPESDVVIEPMMVTPRDKCVTNYKSGFLSGWNGVYLLTGKRKYLDFLFQVGLGGKNSQGFGMFEIGGEKG